MPRISRSVVVAWLAVGVWVAGAHGETLLGLHGINFSPYVNFPEQVPPPTPPDPVSNEKIEDLLTVVAPHTQWVRTFGAQSGLENIPAIASGMGLQVAMGAFLGPDDVVNGAQKDNLVAAVVAGHVDVAVVGNETQVFGALSEGELVGHLQDVRARLDDAGFEDVPVTTAEPFGTSVNTQPGSIFNADGSLKKTDVIANVDVVYLNIYPFFEDGVTISDAVSRLDDLYHAAADAIEDAFPGHGKEIVISETGWPSDGDTPAMGGQPSLENAIRYFHEATQWAEDNGVTIFFFEAYDEQWKGPQTYEKHFGLWTAAGDLKVPEPGMAGVLCVWVVGAWCVRRGGSQR